MGANSKIEWCHHTFNPWRGCTKVSAGCLHCYAETMSGRNPSVLGVWGPKGTRVAAAETYWRQPLKWNAEAKAEGQRRSVFCASLADVGEGPDTMPAESWPVVQAARARLSDLIRACDWLDFLLLTKRPQNMPELFAEDVLRRAWVGTSVEDDRVLDRVDALRAIPARIRFLSCEPLIGPLPGLSLKGIHWVIVGGESGHHARPMHPEWARGIRDQCVAACVPFFFKQWGGVNKKAAGRTLDGRTWDEVPRKEMSPT